MSERQNPRTQLVLRLWDLLIVPEQMRVDALTTAGLPPLQAQIARRGPRSGDRRYVPAKPQSHRIDSLAKEAEPLLLFRDGGLAANGSGHLPDRS